MLLVSRSLLVLNALNRFQNRCAFGARQQRTDIQESNSTPAITFRHIALHDTPCQPFGNKRFADTDSLPATGYFTATTQDPDRAFQFFHDQSADRCRPRSVG